jgi:hypothetical protein
VRVSKHVGSTVLRQTQQVLFSWEATIRYRDKLEPIARGLCSSTLDPRNGLDWTKSKLKRGPFGWCFNYMMDMSNWHQWVPYSWRPGVGFRKRMQMHH